MAAMVSFTIALDYTYKFGGCDLRCRIVGSRLFLDGKSPYFHKWSNSDGPRLLDPNDVIDRKVNGNVVTPAFLLFNVPLSSLAYSDIRVIWTAFQYLFLLSSFLLVNAGCNPRFTLSFGLVSVLLLFLNSNIWFFNIERGQVYVVYSFLFSLIFYLYSRRTGKGKFWAGLVAGFATWIRPLFLVVHAPSILRKDMNWIKGAFIGFISGLIIFFIPFKEDWKDYFNAMKIYERLTFQNQGKDFYYDHYNVSDYVEGVSNLTSISSGFHGRGLWPVQQYLYRKGFYFKPWQLSICLLLIVLICLIGLKRTVKPVDFENPGIFLSIAFFFYILSELFNIGSRGGYNCIQWIFPALLIANSPQKNYLLILLMIGLCFINNLPFNFKYQNELGEMLLLVTLLLYLREKIDDARSSLDYVS